MKPRLLSSAETCDAAETCDSAETHDSAEHCEFALLKLMAQLHISGLDAEH